MIRIGELEVDVRAIAMLDHACRPELCAGRICCCASFEIALDPGEIERIAGLIPEAARFADPAALDNPFDESDDAICLETDEQGRCAFAFGRAGRTLCSLHAAAIELGLDPFACKPAACSLWPLSLSEGEPRGLTVDPSAHEFPCNRRRTRPGPLSGELATAVAALMGRPFARRLAEAVARTAATTTGRPRPTGE